MSFPFWISQKLKLNERNGGANATGVVIAVTGVALAIVIMQLTISIVLGFKHQITERILGFDGQLWVLPEYQSETGATAPTLDLSDELAAVIDGVMPGATTYMRFTQPGLLKTDNDFAGAYFAGFDPEHDYTFERSNIIAGELPDFSAAEAANSIVLSQTMAQSLGLELGEKVNACFFINDAIKARRFTIAAIYESGFGDYDRTVVYAPVNTLRRIAMADSVAGTQLEIVPADPQTDIEAMAEALQEALLEHYQEGRLDQLYPVDNVRHTGALYFNWLELLNTNVVVIFILMICVSGFTLVSSMFIIILERIPTIGILRALGATKRQVRRVFVYLTLKIVGLGMIIGNVIAIALQLVQEHWQVMKLDAEMYYLHHVPVEINWWYILWLNVGVVVVSWLILILPSRVASGISPAVTMRFE